MKTKLLLPIALLCMCFTPVKSQSCQETLDSCLAIALQTYLDARAEASKEFKQDEKDCNLHCNYNCDFHCQSDHYDEEEEAACEEDEADCNDELEECIDEQGECETQANDDYQEAKAQAEIDHQQAMDSCNAKYFSCCNYASIPAKPLAINGKKKVCPNKSHEYSVTQVADVCKYTWVATPSNIGITGQGWSVVTVSFPADFSGGTLEVQACNNIGCSAYMVMNLNLKANCGNREANEEQEDANQNSIVRVYPIPATDKINIEFQSAASKDFQLTVFDIYGRVMMRNSIAAVAGINTINLNTGDLYNGTFLLEITDGNSRVSKSFVIEQ